MPTVDALAQALKGEFAEQVAELLYQKLRSDGMPQKVLLTPDEAAWSLGGFSETAFNQAEWSKAIPVVKIGIKTFYKLKDLETFAANNTITRMSKR